MRQTARRSVRIKDDTHSVKREPYPLNVLPESLIRKIGKRIVHRMALGLPDVSGDDFSRIFAD